MAMAVRAEELPPAEHPVNADGGGTPVICTINITVDSNITSGHYERKQFHVTFYTAGTISDFDSSV